MKNWPVGKVIDPIQREIERDTAIQTVVSKAQRIAGPDIVGKKAIKIGLSWISSMMIARGFLLPRSTQHAVDVIASVLHDRDNIVSLKTKDGKYKYIGTYEYTVEAN